MTADEAIALLGLVPHPEGGWFVETFRDCAGPAGRSISTAIYYLLRAGERSHWHRVDAAEVWHWYAGAPLEIGVSTDGVGCTLHLLGSDLGAGQRPQFIVPAGTWQSAVALGDWALAGCTVAPGFAFAGFELAPPSFAPSRATA